MDISESKAIFHIASLLKKKNSPKNLVSVITLKAYRAYRRICVLNCLKLYLKQSRHLRSSTLLFISNYSFILDRLLVYQSLWLGKRYNNLISVLFIL